MAKDSGTVVPQKAERIAEYLQKKVLGRYVVRDGIHSEGGRTYGQGEVVESRCQLVDPTTGQIVEGKCMLDRWPDKFQRIDDRTGLPIGTITEAEVNRRFPQASSQSPAPSTKSESGSGSSGRSSR